MGKRVMCESFEKKKMTDRSEDASGILRVFLVLFVSVCRSVEKNSRCVSLDILSLGQNGILNFLVLFLPFAIWETASYYCPISWPLVRPPPHISFPPLHVPPTFVNKEHGRRKSRVLKPFSFPSSIFPRWAAEKLVLLWPERRKKKGFQSGKLRVGRGRALCPLGPTKEDTTVRHPKRQRAWAKYEFVSRLNQTFFVPSWRQYMWDTTAVLESDAAGLIFFSYKRKYNLVSLCVGSPRKWLGESVVGGRGLERAEKRRGRIWSWSLVRTEEEKRGRRGWELGVNKIPIRGGCVGVEKLKSERGEQGIAIFAQI